MELRGCWQRQAEVRLGEKAKTGASEAAKRRTSRLPPRSSTQVHCIKSDRFMISQLLALQRYPSCCAKKEVSEGDLLRGVLFLFLNATRRSRRHVPHPTASPTTSLCPPPAILLSSSVQQKHHPLPLLILRQSRTHQTT